MLCSRQKQVSIYGVSILGTFNTFLGDDSNSGAKPGLMLAWAAMGKKF